MGALMDRLQAEGLKPACSCWECGKMLAAAVAALEHIRKVSNEQGGCDYIDIDSALAELSEGR